MVRKALVLGASFAVALQLAALPTAGAAQEYTWHDNRPDGVPPAGMYADRILPEGAFELVPIYKSFDFSGTRVGNQFVSFQELFQFFEQVPFAMSSDLVLLNASYGASDDVTLLARFGWVEHSRDVVNEDIDVFNLESEGVTDLELHALWDVFEQGAWRAHLQGGIIIPTGSIDEEDEAPGFRAQGTLPYDMQTGAGVVGFVPGATIQTMNEFGSVGLQLLGKVYVGENDNGWRPGHAVEANGWAAYRLNDYFSLSSGLRATAWSAIEGFDQALQPERDPGELPTSFAGERVDIPLGLNLMIGDGPLAGHRLAVEFLFTVHEEFDGPWLAADDGFVISWRKMF